MIDDSVGEAVLRAVSKQERFSGPSIELFLSKKPCFKNIDYPFALPGLFVKRQHVKTLVPRVEAYVKLLEKVIALYRRNTDVRRFYALPAHAEKLIDAEGNLERSICVCRLDGYLEEGSQDIRILENNSDAPAGTLFTTRLNEITRELLGDLVPPSISLLPLDRGEVFLDALYEAYRHAGGRKASPHIAVLQPKGWANRESAEIVSAMTFRGWSAVLVDPREIGESNEGLVHEGRRIDLIWNKINMTSWNQLIADAPSVVGLFVRCLERGTMPVNINSFGARHVAEAKTTLAFLHDPRFRDYFAAAELELIRALIPFTAKLERNHPLIWNGRSFDSAELSEFAPAEWVLKEQYDIRGDGVTIGRSTETSVWKNKIDAAFDTGAVLQRYVAPQKYGVRLASDTGRIEKMNVSMDSFVFNGKLCGFGAKASRNDKINLFQGGSKLAVMVING